MLAAAAGGLISVASEGAAAGCADAELKCRTLSKIVTPETARWATSTFESKYLADYETVDVTRCSCTDNEYDRLRGCRDMRTVTLNSRRTAWKCLNIKTSSNNSPNTARTPAKMAGNGRPGTSQGCTVNMSRLP